MALPVRHIHATVELRLIDTEELTNLVTRKLPAVPRIFLREDRVEHGAQVCCCMLVQSSSHTLNP
jgi:hypothetical protein